MSLIVALEGPDAVGKKTQSEKLAKRLRADIYSFPDYKTASGELVDSHLHHGWTCVLNPNERARFFGLETNPEHMVNAMVFQALQCVSRLERRDAIIDSLKRRSVVLDRYWLSGLVYGSIDGLSEPWLRTINENVMPKPDVWILLDVPLDESVRRSIERNPHKRDRYESNTNFMTKIRNRYLEVFKQMQTERAVCHECGGLVDPCSRCNNTGIWPVWRIVDGMGTEEEVHERIVNTIKERHAYYFCKDTATSHR